MERMLHRVSSDLHEEVSVDANYWAIQTIIRDRLNDARTRARVAALLVEARGSRDPNAVKTRFTDLGRHLLNRLRKVVDDIAKEERAMTYILKPLSLEPTKLKGLSEKLIVSHWENNYGGAVRRLNAIAAQLAELDFAKAPIFVINGLKREELIAANSMILHELYFGSLGGDGISGGLIEE